MVPWIIEAPINAVEILEAILKPSHPFKIHTARHVRCGCTRTARRGFGLAGLRKRHAEYTQLQGRLEADRDISFICMPGTTVYTIRQRLFGVFTTVRLQYISIPWATSPEARALVHPMGSGSA